MPGKGGEFRKILKPSYEASELSVRTFEVTGSGVAIFCRGELKEGERPWP